MRFIFSQNSLLRQFMADFYDLPAELPDGEMIGIAGKSGQILAAALYHDFHADTGNISMTLAAAHPRWAVRGNIVGLLRYPFLQLQCRRVTATVAASNIMCLRFLQGIGFEKEGVLREGFGTEDAILLGLLRREFDALCTRFSI
ncbi:MAG: GNAT family N-acetyltransferase [Alphaproteobacteria bacterium]